MVETGSEPAGRGVTPQAVVLTMFGRFCADIKPTLSTAGYISLLSRIGLSAHGTRLTLSRMATRGFLERVRLGREAYFRLTEFGWDIVRTQDQHTFEDASSPAGRDGAWTILSFSLPESHRRERHLLRRRLAWDGFGLLRDGVWIAPGEHDISAVLSAEVFDGVRQFVDGFTAFPTFGDVERMISRTWQLDELAQQYEEFLADWNVPEPRPAATDELGRYLQLVTTWRQLIRATPRLPAEHLPEKWPAFRCQNVFRRLHQQYRPPAERIFNTLLARHRWPVQPVEEGTS